MSWPFHSLAEFFAMGGYATYVWPAYGLAIAILIGNVLQPILQRKKLLKQLQHDK